jgi:hypothetical protein
LLGRYFLSMTPPLPASELEAARALGRRRFNLFLNQMANRLGTDGRFTAEIVERLGQADQARATERAVLEADRRLAVTRRSAHNTVHPKL